MIGDLISAVDLVARIVGWLVLIGGVVWGIAQSLQAKKHDAAKVAESKSQNAFEQHLQEHQPDKFRQYLQVKDRYMMDGETVHWARMAKEAGCDRDLVFRFF
jgi:hypothetical protein